jgi:cell division protein FtsN
MPRTEEGEFELVLGNKQLLSVFFIIVILLGVFFTMGYIVGRNSAPVSANADRPAAVQPPTTRPDGPSAMPTKQPAEQPAAAPPIEQSQPTATAPETATPGASNTRKPTPMETAKPAEAASAGNPAKVVNPEPGQTFVQVSSMLDQPAAEILVDVLGKKGFRAIIAPGPNEGKFRVLVGPVKDPTDAGRVRGDLEQAGFKGAFLKKY